MMKCEDHDSQLREEIAAYDNEYVEEDNSIFDHKKGTQCSNQ